MKITVRNRTFEIGSGHELASVNLRFDAYGNVSRLMAVWGAGNGGYASIPPGEWIAYEDGTEFGKMPVGVYEL